MQIKVGFKEMVRRAEAEIETISAAQALDVASREETLFVDLRDIRELQREGKIPGARHVPRGMLEFWIDPQSPYHKPLFTEERRFVFYCNLGWRSALAAQVAQQMGLENVCHIAGGFEAWKAAGGAVEELKK
ncbi:metal-dependent hydrolase [Desulfuromonas sp. DDH964]|nr:rhodanese-like domain-containing protein [Desulfuromonas sp. DDH964]AMV72608.1 metal-dependent hydrolase [Desulfuromonas sp. DDH964]